jgi:hypothetical protein
VASQLERLKFHVQTARAYNDSAEGKSREIDVWATRRFLEDEPNRILGISEIIAECKNSSNPFVFLTRKKSGADDYWKSPQMRFPVDPYEARKPTGPSSALLQHTPAFEELGIKPIHHFHMRETKAVQFARIDRNGSRWVANHAGLYDAIFLPLLKAFRSRWDETRPRGGKEDWRYFWFFYPIVVVRGKIYEIDTSVDERRAVEVPHIPFVRDLKMEGLEGRFLVDFVNEDHLPKFVSDVVGANENHIVSRYTSEPSTVLTKEREWKNA